MKTASAHRVVVEHDAASTYPSRVDAPFHPSEQYPEYVGDVGSAHANHVYAQVREALRHLGLDEDHFGQTGWNPIGSLVPAGSRILIKPNWVMHENPGGGGTDCLVTHPSVLRPVLDYVMLAKPSEIIVGDSPIQDCDFDQLMALGFAQVLDYIRSKGQPVRVVDFRRTTLQQTGHALNVNENVRPLTDYVTVDLGARSLLEPIAQDAERFRVTRYDPSRMKENHQAGIHRYLVARDILSADLVINLPKLKTHKKAGITASLKNLVGINGNKDYLPHHRKGPATSGGDNYEQFSFLKWLAEELLDFSNRRLDRPVLVRECNRAVYYLLVLNMKLGGTGDVEGGWYGNDTVWRMCLDLNRLLLYANKHGEIESVPQRKELSIVDAIIAGDGEGPLKPAPRDLRVIMGALNPAAADWVAAYLLGLDPERIPIVKNAFGTADLPVASFNPENVECVLNGDTQPVEKISEGLGIKAKPSRGWTGHCEL